MAKQVNTHSILKQTTTKTHKRSAHLSSKSKTSSPTMAQQRTTSSATTYSAGFHGASVKRIRTPHPHDVLLGRGGSINSHVGNIRFREWVSVRKNDYNLAPNKNEKARVAREVIALVHNQSPPGRFLQKDNTASSSMSSGGGWWVEVHDDRMMAKTSQALREGAPLIRAAHKDELEERRAIAASSYQRQPRAVQSSVASGAATTSDVHTSTEYSDLTKRHNEHSFAITSLDEPTSTDEDSIPIPQKIALEQLRANVEAAKQATPALQLEYSTLQPQSISDVKVNEGTFERPGKRVRLDYNGQVVRPTDATPPLLPTSAQAAIEQLPDMSLMQGMSALIPPPIPMPSRVEVLPRTHSLALSDVSTGDLSEDFINPFEDEADELEAAARLGEMLPPRPGVLRDSISSDMGGWGALVRTNALNSSQNPGGSSSRAVRSQSGSSMNLNPADGRCSSSSSSRSLTLVLSDLPDVASNSNTHNTDFTEGMKMIYEALHPVFGEEEKVPTHLLPYRGGGYRHFLRPNGSNNTSNAISYLSLKNLASCDRIERQ